MEEETRIGVEHRAIRSRALGAVIVLLLAAACTSAGDTGGSTTGADSSSSSGGTLRVAVPDAEIFDLDPQRAYDGTSWEVFRCCLLRTLYSYNGTPTAEGGAVPRPDLPAGPPEVSSDGLTWTFRLKDGLHFAPPFEDTPIRTLDVVRGLERMARYSPDQTYSGYFDVISGFEDYASGSADSIIGLETPDDRTLVVRLGEVTGDLAYRFSMPATAPIPEGAADGHDDYGPYLVASGPYMIEGSEDLDFSAPAGEQTPLAGYRPAQVDKEFVTAQAGSLTLVRNPSWDPVTDRLRAAYPDRIEISLSDLNDDEIARRVDDDKVDLAFGSASPFEQVARYRDDPGLEDRLFVDQADGSFDVTMNLATPPFDDVHVRRAVSLSIDKDAL